MMTQEESLKMDIFLLFYVSKGKKNELNNNLANIFGGSANLLNKDVLSKEDMKGYDFSDLLLNTAVMLGRKEYLYAVEGSMGCNILLEMLRDPRFSRFFGYRRMVESDRHLLD